MTSTPVERCRGTSLQLVARRLRLEAGPPIDPFALAGRSGRLLVGGERTLVGIGTSLVIDLPDGLDGAAGLDAAARSLASIPCDDRCRSARSGIVALGALPFERSLPGSLVVPAVTYCRETDGAEWVTFVSGQGADLPDDAAGSRARLIELADRSEAGRRDATRVSAGPTRPEPDRREPVVRSRTSDEDFAAMVGDALEAIEAGGISKVVLARWVDVDMGTAIPLAAVLRRWRQLEPACTLFSMPTADGEFVGASPELLVERNGRRLRSRPLAGTTARAAAPGDRGRLRDRTAPLPEDLLRSTKDASEHRYVVDTIAEALAPLCSRLDVPVGPDLVHLHSITHFGTSISGELSTRSDGTLPTALDLVAALHPTPAVAGVPTDPARALIAELEPFPRGAYAGPVGYLDGGGDGAWMVGIRAFTVNGEAAALAAGVGIVDGSHPDTELAETDLKLRAVFDALAPGASFEASPGHAPRAATVERG